VRRAPLYRLVTAPRRRDRCSAVLLALVGLLYVLASTMEYMARR
jgi:hypothetical protein